MSIQDRDQWIHDCFAENYDILVVRAKRRADMYPEFWTHEKLN